MRAMDIPYLVRDELLAFVNLRLTFLTIAILLVLFSPLCMTFFHPRLGFSRLRPLTRYLPGSSVEAIPKVDGGNGKNQRRKYRLIIMTGSFIPNLARLWR